MDFPVSLEGSKGQGAVQFVNNTDVRTAIFNSLNTRKGTFFQNRDFGLQYIDKITQSNIALFEQYIKAALNWMIAAGVATVINVTVEQDLTDHTRLDAAIQVTQPSGYVLSYSQWFYIVN